MHKEDREGPFLARELAPRSPGAAQPGETGEAADFSLNQGTSICLTPSRPLRSCAISRAACRRRLRQRCRIETSRNHGGRETNHPPVSPGRLRRHGSWSRVRRRAVGAGSLEISERPRRRAGSTPAGVPLRRVVTGGKPSEDAGSATLAPRERAVSPVANGQHWRLGCHVALRQCETRRKMGPYRKPQLRRSCRK